MSARLPGAILPPEPVPVVIVGGGPTGITAAILLATYGVRCVVLERWDEIYPQPRAVHLDDELYRLLGRMGVADKFAAITRPALGLQVIDQDHRVLARFERSATAGVHGYPQANLFDQPELEEILRNRLADLHLATLRSGGELVAMIPSADGVALQVLDRQSQRVEQIQAQYVLGCDGANSLVRSLIGARMEDLKFVQQWLVVDVETDRELDQWEGVHQLSARERAGTYMRIGQRRYRWEFQLRPGERAEDFASLHALHPLIRPWTGEVPLDELHLVRSAGYTFRAQIADRWRDGRVFLLGDAAHLTPPFIGQGMGAGLRDAANVTWKLAGVLQGRLPESVLDSYQAERRPHARAMIRLAISIGVAMTGGGVAGDVFRRLLLPHAHLVPGIRQSVTDSETPALRSSALVRKRRGRRGLEGRLCPNADLGDGRRLDDVVDGAAVVTVRPVAPEVSAALAERDIQVLEVDRGSELGRWLARGRAGAVLVRPDGTVFAGASDPSQLVGLWPVA